MSSPGEEYVAALEARWQRYEEKARALGMSEPLIATYREIFFGGALSLSSLMRQSMTNASTPLEAIVQIDSAVRQVHADALSRISATRAIQKAQRDA
jgi:hypothetical protein